MEKMFPSSKGRECVGHELWQLQHQIPSQNKYMFGHKRIRILQVVDPGAEKCLLSGQADRLNSEQGKMKWKQDGETSEELIPRPDYKVKNNLFI